MRGIVRDKDGGETPYTSTYAPQGWRALLSEDFEGDALGPAWYVPQSDRGEATWGVARCPACLIYAGARQRLAVGLGRRLRARLPLQPGD